MDSESDHFSEGKRAETPFKSAQQEPGKVLKKHVFSCFSGLCRTGQFRAQRVGAQSIKYRMSNGPGTLFQRVLEDPLDPRNNGFSRDNAAVRLVAIIPTDSAS